MKVGLLTRLSQALKAREISVAFVTCPLCLPFQTPQRRAVSSVAILDREAQRRKDSEWVKSQESHPFARFLPFRQLKVLASKSPTASFDVGLKWLGRQEACIQGTNELTSKTHVLLGLKDDIPHFALDVSEIQSNDFNEHGKFEEVRTMLMKLGNKSEIEIMGRGRSLIEWHNTHKFCSNCGHATLPTEGGFKTVCKNKSCETEHYPKINPVAIVLVVKGNKCLLGRQPKFPQGVYSCLAGFIETGETLEECVRREVLEETGVHVGKIRYHSSQAWPFPSQLMLGCIAEAESEAILVDNEELEDARWIEREELLVAIEKSTDFKTKDFRIPPPIAIAHHLAKAWASNEVSTSWS